MKKKLLDAQNKKKMPKLSCENEKRLRKFSIVAMILFIASCLASAVLFFKNVAPVTIPIETDSILQDTSTENVNHQKELQRIIQEDQLKHVGIALNVALASTILLVIIMFCLMAFKNKSCDIEKEVQPKASMSGFEKIMAVWFTMQVGPWVILLFLLLLSLSACTIAAAVKLNFSHINEKYKKCSQDANVKSCLKNDKDIQLFEQMMLGNVISFGLFIFVFFGRFLLV